MNVFEYALKMEKDGEDYYRSLADKAENPGLKAILTMLADEEVKHHHFLEQMAKQEGVAQMEGSSLVQEVKNIFEKMSTEKSQFHFTGEEADWYAKARETEKNSEAFYIERANEAKDEAEKAILLRIADEEKKHVRVMDNLVDFVSRPETWLEDAEWHNLEVY